MAALPFSAPTVLRNIDASLPTGVEYSPQLKSPHDAVAIFVHACMLSVGFRLIGLSEDDRLPTPIEGASPQPLPATWNASPGNYGFRYAHSQSSLHFLLKINRLGTKTVIMGLGLGDDKTASFEILTTDFLTPSFFPYDLHATPHRPLENAFTTAASIATLASLLKINIVQKLIPGLSKPGYTEDTPSRLRANPYADPLRADPYNDPYATADPLRYPPPRRPMLPGSADAPPGFDDEYEVLAPPRGGYGGGRHPLSIGADDLNPPGLGPGAPFFGGGGVGGGDGGMHPTGDHPMFGGRAEPLRDPRFPMGARYDPVGPGDEPRGGLRGPRGPFQGGGGFPGGFPGQGGGYGGGYGADFM